MRWRIPGWSLGVSRDDHIQKALRSLTTAEGEQFRLSPKTGRLVPATIVCQSDTFTFKLDQALADNGAPSAAAPKIFFRYYYVNSSTGEKSGVMLADVTWTAGA